MPRPAGETGHVFFPIDGLRDISGAARDALARLPEQDFGCRGATGYGDSGNNFFDDFE